MSHLTPQQSIDLKAYILNPANGLSQWTSGPGTDYGAIAAALNADANPVFKVWRTSVTRAEIQDDDAFAWTLVDNLSTNSKYRIWEWMFDNAAGAINPSKDNIRAGISATWVGTAQLVAVATMTLNKCKRNATRLERLFAAGTGTDATPGKLVFEGSIDLSHIAEMFNAQ